MTSTLHLCWLSRAFLKSIRERRVKEFRKLMSGIPCWSVSRRSGTWPALSATGTPYETKTVGRQFGSQDAFQEAVATTLTLAGFQALTSDGKTRYGNLQQRWSVERSTCSPIMTRRRFSSLERVRRACRKPRITIGCFTQRKYYGGCSDGESRIADARVVLWSESDPIA